MSDTPILPARLDWPSTIGNFLLTFGTLDYLVAVLLKDNLERLEFEQFRERHFKDRVTRIARHFSESDYPKEIKEEFAHLLIRLNPIRDLRNHIAHGYMLARLDPDTNTLVTSVSLPKDLDQEYSQGTRHVTFNELHTNLTDLTELIEVFKKLAGFKPRGSTGIDIPE
jgi:hypothetical protein